MIHRPNREAVAAPGRWRAQLVVLLLALCAGVLVARAVYLQVIHRGFLEQQGDALARGQLALGVLRGDALGAAATARGLALGLQGLDDLLHGGDPFPLLRWP